LITRFGAFSLDSEGYVLAKGTEPISLEPQVFNLLYYLLENRDRVVSKDNLIEHVWEGRIVSDAAITSAINLARRAVEDDGKTQAVIKTFPKKGFRFVAEINNDTTTATTALAPIANHDKPSIAVLAFENMSGDPEQEYFSDGMAEDLITDLSNISGLFVAARNSSFSFKGQMPYVQEVAEKLGVRFVLEGSVRKMGDRLRVNAQLIDAADGDHLWAKRYDGDMDEIFEFQDRIRTEIVAALELKLTPSDQAQIGLSHLLLGHNEEAVAGFKRTIEQAPKFFSAYLYLALAYVELDQPDDASQEINTFLEFVPQYTLKDFEKIFPYQLNEVRDRLLGSVRQA